MKTKRIAKKLFVLVLTLLMLMSTVSAAVAQEETAYDMRVYVFVDQQFSGVMCSENYAVGDTVSIHIDYPVPGRILLDDKTVYTLQTDDAFDGTVTLEAGEHTLKICTEADKDAPVYAQTFAVQSKANAYFTLLKNSGRLFLDAPASIIGMGPAVIAPPFALIALGIIAGAFVEYFSALGKFKNLF